MTHPVRSVETVADVANGWAAVLSPPGWTPEKTDKLRPLLHSDALPSGSISG